MTFSWIFSKPQNKKLLGFLVGFALLSCTGTEVHKTFSLRENPKESIMLLTEKTDFISSKKLKPFYRYFEVHGLTIAGLNGVSDEFLVDVGKTYEAMFPKSGMDASMQSRVFDAAKNPERGGKTLQRVGLSSHQDMHLDELPGWDFTNDHNQAVDFIWEMNEPGTNQVNEVLEHLLHTLTAIVFYQAFPEEWDYLSEESLLVRAMREAIQKGHYDISSYESILDDSNEDEEKYDVHKRIIAQEFAYWLIMAEWDNFPVIGLSSNEEWNITNPQDVESKLSLGHELYTRYVQKIMAPPDPSLMRSLYH